MKKYMAMLLVLILFLSMTSFPAMAQPYTYDSIHASIDLPEDTYETVLTPNTLENNAAFLSQQGTDVESARAEFEAEGILMKAYDTDNNRVFVFSALQTVDAQMYFDLNNQDEDMRREFRVSHKDGSAYGVLGYDYSSASWTNHGGNVLRFLNTQYTLRQGGEVSCYGYQKKTIRNGYTITLDMQVYGRKTKESDLNALNKIMDSFAFTEILPMPTLPAKLILSSTPPTETADDTFTVKGTTNSRANVTVTVLSLASSDSSLFTDTANSDGAFAVDVTLPREGVYTVTIAAEGENTLRSQVSYTVTYQEGLLSVSLLSQPGAALADETVVSGSTISGVDTQLVVNGPNGYAYDKSTTNKSFSFTVDTSAEGEYQFFLTFNKSGYSTRTFTYTGNRAMSESERKEAIRNQASSPEYSSLKKNTASYEGDTVTYTGYIAQINETKSVGEWTLVLATEKNGEDYDDLIYVIAASDPQVSLGQKVKMYGKAAGDFPIVNENTSYPRCELYFFESAE